MQKAETAYTVKELTFENVGQIKDLFENFKSRAVQDYKFELPPLEFSNFAESIRGKMIKGFVLYENKTPAGFLLYYIETSNAIELNLIHILNNEDIHSKRKHLLQALIDKYKKSAFWNVISYPLLGVQEDFVREITQFGFKMVGQATVRFKFTDRTSPLIFKNLVVPYLPMGYKIIEWSNEYFDQASEVIHEAFKDASDANFDPRFLTLEGSKDVVNKITSEIFGTFLPDATSLLIHDDKVVGVCFVNMTNAIIANVPLIGVKHEYAGKGFGKILLKNSVDKVIKMIINAKIMANEINATVETENYAALRMYRKIGFREDYTYAHAYLKNLNYKKSI
jgi:ribosomal protein S18 acetylase RimI-like enzyme